MSQVKAKSIKVLNTNEYEQQNQILTSRIENYYEYVGTPPRRNLESSLSEDLPSDITTSQLPEDTVDRVKASKLIKYPIPPTEKRDSVHAIQEWEGYVIGIEQENFVANLIDITSAAKIESEEATIPLEELSFATRQKLQLGSIFRWIIGYHQSSSGQRTRVSQIVFRDLPAYTEDDIDKGSEWARLIAKKFGS